MSSRTLWIVSGGAEAVPGLDRADTDAVVGDGEPRAAVDEGQRDRDPPGLCVFGDVAEQLPRRPVEQPVDRRATVGGPPVDVELGSVVSLGFNQNGERDVVSYIEHVRPRFFIPNHMTAVAVEGSSLEWKDGFIDALNAPGGLPAAAQPQILWIVDPNDYLRPIVFDVHDHSHF